MVPIIYLYALRLCDIFYSIGQTPLHCAVLAHGLSKEDDVIDSKDIITELKRHNAQLGAKVRIAQNQAILRNMFVSDFRPHV